MQIKIKDIISKREPNLYETLELIKMINKNKKYNSYIAGCGNGDCEVVWEGEGL